VKKPNLCIVTEYMPQGSLSDILSTSTIKLTWNHKLRLLRSAALGINYLHSLQPVIVHRDLKPANLLVFSAFHFFSFNVSLSTDRLYDHQVDENWNVKVADFGFARIKEENATMTRCGTPCWTAPEIIRGEKNYDERADLFSFGIIMWQVATRKEPFAGRNFMGVTLDVLEGRRPQIPNDCPAEFRRVMKKCWNSTAAKRPRMEEVVAFLERQMGDDGAHSALGSP
jgi:serine/threonine protein kinase